MNELLQGFVYHQEKCLQCHGCETACRIWRATERGITWRRVLNLWHGVYPTVTCASLSLSCLHCAEPACAAVCPSGAIVKSTEDGLVLVDRALCTGCRACVDACPYGVPVFGADGSMQKCDMCRGYMRDGAPPCVRTCPTGALETAMMTPAEKIEAEKQTAVLYRQSQAPKK